MDLLPELGCSFSEKIEPQEEEEEVGEEEGEEESPRSYNFLSARC